jgi:uncharacterized lipoprotein YddW (UPF0748 family)
MNGNKNVVYLILFGFSLFVIGGAIWGVTQVGAVERRQLDEFAYAPIIYRADNTPTPLPTATATPSPTATPLPEPTPTVDPNVNYEFRGMWVSRFDWTSAFSPAQPSKIDEIVENAANAGINAIFFQVRATADSYYTPGLEPWAQRVSGTYGQAPNPLWDPLGYFIQKAHTEGIQLHAYLNIYPVWLPCNSVPDPNVFPLPLYHKLANEHGTTNGKLNGAQWEQDGDISCESYIRATPASAAFDTHLLGVVHDLIVRYDIDGIHLDHIRYANGASCDPVSQASSGVPCFAQPPSGYDSYESWQRAQVNGTVNKVYQKVLFLDPSVLVSAAVWPIYIDYWGWGGQEGYHDYYQDSKAWLAGGYIDAITPMIYSGNPNCPDTGFFTQSRWSTLVNDFNEDNAGRFVIAGINGDYCSFAEIEARIEAARNAGTAGHAFFSYSGLLANGHFDDLANGPYAEPAQVPPITWR